MELSWLQRCKLADPIVGLGPNSCPTSFFLHHHIYFQYLGSKNNSSPDCLSSTLGKMTFLKLCNYLILSTSKGRVDWKESRDKAKIRKYFKGHLTAFLQGGLWGEDEEKPCSSIHLGYTYTMSKESDYPAGVHIHFAIELPQVCRSEA